MTKSFLIKGEIWRWPGNGGWHFLTVDKKISEKIKKVSKSYGAGFVKVRLTTGETIWETALFPHKKEGVFLISVNKQARTKENLFEGDIIKIKIEII